MKKDNRFILTSVDIRTIKNYSQQNISECFEEIANTKSTSMWNEYELIPEQPRIEMENKFFV